MNSRDLILSKPGAFQRLRKSADNNYWYGRVLRVYLSTISWNLNKRQFFTALSRMFYSLAFFVLSIHRVLTVQYWSGLMAHHAPETLHYVMKEYEQSKAAIKT